jgi:hypothetical protein
MPGFDRDAERRLEARGVLRDHEGDFQLVQAPARHRHTDQAAPIPGHEVDHVRRDGRGGDGEITLVLAVLVVHDDDHLPRANRLDRVFDRGEGTALP